MQQRGLKLGVCELQSDEVVNRNYMAANTDAHLGGMSVCLYNAFAAQPCAARSRIMGAGLLLSSCARVCRC